MTGAALEDPPASAAGAAADPAREARMGAVLILTASLSFAAMAIFIKKAFACGFTLWPLLTLRFTFGGIILWTWIAAAKVPLRAAPRQWGLLVALGAVAYTVMPACYVKSVQELPVSKAAILLFTYPPLAALLAWLTGGERVGLRKWFAIALAMVGAFLVKQGGDEKPVGNVVEGATAALVAAAVYAVYLVISARQLKGVPAQLSAAVVATSAAVVFAIIAVARGESFVPKDPLGWLWVGLLAIVPTVVGMQAFFAGARRVPPTRAAVLGTAEPMFAVLLGAVFLQESLHWVQLYGTAAVLGAALLSAPRK